MQDRAPILAAKARKEGKKKSSMTRSSKSVTKVSSGSLLMVPPLPSRKMAARRSKWRPHLQRLRKLSRVVLPLRKRSLWTSSKRR